MWWQALLAQDNDAQLWVPLLHSCSTCDALHGVVVPFPLGCDVGQTLVMLTLRRSIEPCKGLLNPVFSEGTEFIVWAQRVSDLPCTHVSAVSMLLLSWAGWTD